MLVLVSALLFKLALVIPPVRFCHHAGGFSTAPPASQLATAGMTGSRKRVRVAAAPSSVVAAGAASPHDVVDDIEDLPAGLVDGYRQHQALQYHDFSQDEVSFPRKQPACASTPTCTLACHDCSA